MKHGVKKYLVAGHTQMECDSMHSTIERKIVSDIFTPRDYMVLMENARTKPYPYKVCQVSHNEIMKLMSPASGQERKLVIPQCMT